MRKFLAFIILLSLFGSAVSSAQGGVTVNEVTVLSLSTGASARIFPAPNAQLVAYDSSIRLNSHVDRYLTISTAAPGDEPAYFEKPEDLPRGFEADAASFFIPFAWSPDSGRLAVTSQPLVTLTDTDLWVFDIAAETWVNLADDGYSGGIAAADAPPPGTIVDVQPTWSPDGTTIAVERTVIGADGLFGPPNYALINAETGAARELAAVPGTASTGATTSMAWSADGATLVVTLRHLNADAEADGVWLFDAATGAARQLLTLAQVGDALHTVMADLELTSVGPAVWSPDSSQLLLWAGRATGTPIQVWPFVVDAATGAIASAPIPAHPRDSATARGLRPLQAAWSPDSSSLLVFTFGLHPDEDTTSLDPQESSVRGAVRVLDLAGGGGQLLGYLPLGKTPLYYAAWAADGQAIINGYHLALEQP